MNRPLLLITIFCFAACSSPREEPEQPKRYTIAQFMDIIQMNGGAFSSDETRVMVNTKESGTISRPAKRSNSPTT
jgi:hypothetical protein